VAKRSIRRSAFIAKDSFKSKAAALSDAARRKVRFVSDQLQSRDREVFECHFGERSDSLRDQPGTAPGRAAPIRNLLACGQRQLSQRVRQDT